MIGFEVSEVIHDTPENVFAFVEDPDLAPLWLIKVTKTENLTGGPVRAGTQFRETRTTGTRESTGIITVTRHEGPPEKAEPPYYHSGSAVALGTRATYHYTFEPEPGGGTRVSLRCEAEPVSWFGRIAYRSMARIMQREDGDQLAFLKQAIEEDME